MVIFDSLGYRWNWNVDFQILKAVRKKRSTVQTEHISAYTGNWLVKSQDKQLSRAEELMKSTKSLRASFSKCEDSLLRYEEKK